MTENTLYKWSAIKQELANLKCTNPNCDKKETRVQRMGNFTVANGTDGKEFFDNIRFTEKICCSSFQEIIEKKYNYLREYLITD